MEYYSFLFYCKIDTFNGEVSFRLLTEYYSFLCKVYSLETIRLGKCVSVSLRSIIHSYESRKNYNNAGGGVFPSPYGVSFILIKI